MTSIREQYKFLWACGKRLTCGQFEQVVPRLAPDAYRIEAAWWEDEKRSWEVHQDNLSYYRNRYKETKQVRYIGLFKHAHKLLRTMYRNQRPFTGAIL